MNNYNEKINKLAFICQTTFPLPIGNHSETVVQISKLMSGLAPFHFENWNTMSDEEREKIISDVVDKYEGKIGIKSEAPAALEKRPSKDSWLYRIKESSDCPRRHFERYRQYLIRKGYAEDVINKIELACEQILADCANPEETEENEKKKKGLVVGDVQSGKTSNYMGLINLAFDYGYKIVVILAGDTNSLRKQTQKRTDAGTIGAISTSIGGKIEYIGVGAEEKDYYVIPFTDQENDFKTYIKKGLHSLFHDYAKPVILVVKKREPILRNVNEHLQSAIEDLQKKDKSLRKFSKSLLIIDDEADSASVNTSANPERPTAINRCIRNLFNMFPVATYVGYTATPFANVFIRPDDDDEGYKDLFPSDFIFLLESPSNYFGGWKVFPQGDEPVPSCIKILDVNEPNFLPVNHRRDYQYRDLAESLKKSILCFLINNVIRTIRGQQTEHRSMMINISRFNDVQEQVLEKVKDYCKKIRNVIEQTSLMSQEVFLANEEMKKMYSLYAEDPFYRDIRSKNGEKKPVSWDEIQKGLYSEIKELQIVVINSKNGNINKIGKDGQKSRFDYDDYEKTGARVIAIGGMVLSRGLTLEGLMISYYSRNAGTYDCLLQMCRWFGYRPDYEDLCRIYLSRENIRRFGSVLEAVDDMKRQFKDMVRKNKKPSNYGLMIRENPYILETQLLVTARNKSRGATSMSLYLNYGGVYADTSKLYKDAKKNNINRDAIEQELLQHIKFNEKGEAYNVPKSYIANCIRKLSIPALNKKFDTDGLSKYIEEHDAFNAWDVLIETGKSNVLFMGKYKAVQRSFEVNGRDDMFIRLGGTNNRVMEPGAFRTGLSKIEEDALNIRLEKKKNDPDPKKQSNNLSISDYLAEREKPLFIVYPIELLINNDGENEEIRREAKCTFGEENVESSLLFAFGIGFPQKESEVRFVYKLNQRKQDEINEEVETEDEDEGVDDGD